MNAILAYIRSKRKIALAVGTSGIASILLRGGRTAHSRFKLSLKIDPSSMCHFSKRSHTGKLLIESTVIIWDEISMANKDMIECVDRSLRKIMDIDEPFGGKIVIFGGDFRQTLPVIKGGDARQVTSSTAKKSIIWRDIVQFGLLQNERVRRNGNTPSSRLFSEFLLSIGEGIVQNENTISEHSIKIPETYILPTQRAEDLVDWVYPDLSIEFPLDTAILATKNSDVDWLNRLSLQKFPGEQFDLLSVDTVNTESIDGK